MSDQSSSDDEPTSSTSPDGPTHEATKPPDNPPVDDRAVAEGEDKLGQAGGGH